MNYLQALRKREELKKEIETLRSDLLTSNYCESRDSLSIYRESKSKVDEYCRLRADIAKATLNTFEEYERMLQLKALRTCVSKLNVDSEVKIIETDAIAASIDAKEKGRILRELESRISSIQDCLDEENNKIAI